MKFDPMTGEPIEESEIGLEQQTYSQSGETTVLYQEQAYDQQQAYNQQQQSYYDQQQAYNQQQQGYYDQQQMYNQQQAYYNQQVYAQPAPSRKKWLIPAIIGAATVTVAAIAVVVILVSNLFLSPANRIMAAAGNTFNEAGVWGEFASAMEKAANSKESTVYMMVDMAGAEVEAEYRHTQGDKQAWILVDISGMPELEGTATLIKNELQLYSPLAGDTLFFYNYVDENTGALIDELGEENVEMLNKMLTTLYTGDTETNEELVKSLKEWSDELEFVELDKEKFEINGKDVACAGYAVTIDGDKVCELLDIMDEAVTLEMDVEGMEEAVASMEASLDEMKAEISESPDVTLSFYLDSNMFAAIVVEVDGEEETLELLFQGGDYRAQNMVVLFDEEEIFEIKGETEDNVETVEFVMSGIEVISYEYDTKSGDLELTIINGYDDVIVEANVKCDNNGVVIEDGSVKVSGIYIDFEFSCTKGADIEKVTGERFDIGNASQEEIMEIMQDIQSELY